MSDVHITENSLYRIAGQPESPNGAICACGARPERIQWRGTERLNTQALFPDGTQETFNNRFPHVDCPTCRVLLDLALERGDVRGAIRALTGGAT